MACSTAFVAAQASFESVIAPEDFSVLREKGPGCARLQAREEPCCRRSWRTLESGCERGRARRRDRYHVAMGHCSRMDIRKSLGRRCKISSFFAAAYEM